MSPLSALESVPDEGASLVRAAQAGNREAFGELYRRFSRLVHGVLLARLPRNLPALKRLFTLYGKEFRTSLRAESEASQHRWRRRLWQMTRKAGKLVEELSPRTDLLEEWTEELQRQSSRLSTLARNGGAEHAEELQAALRRHLVSPEELARLNCYHAHVLAKIGPQPRGTDLEWLRAACAAIEAPAA